MKLTEFIKPELVWVQEKAASRDELLKDIAQRVNEQYNDIDPDQLFQALESKTVTPDGVGHR